MPLRSEFLPHLADPGPESWARILDTLREAQSDVQLAEDAAHLQRELRSWPPEVERPMPKWATECPAVRPLCRILREVDLYDLYIHAAAQALSLRLSDGAPAVRLRRQFTGALQGARGRVHRVGQRGQGDLCGSVCLEVAGGRLAAYVEVEVKRDRGRLSEVQAAHATAVRRRGEVYVVARRTAEMVSLLTEERDRLMRMIGDTSS